MGSACFRKGVEQLRGGPQLIPRPANWRVGPGAAWADPEGRVLDAISVDFVRAALEDRGEPPALRIEVPVRVAGQSDGSQRRRPAAVACILFDEADQAHVVLTRRSARMRSHTSQVAFPGGRIDPGETALEAALREVREEVGIPSSDVEIFGQLATTTTAVDVAPITPFVGSVPSRPQLIASPAEVDRAFTVPLVELLHPEVYREEIWTLDGGGERSIEFFELYGDTVWGATSRMLSELLGLVVGYAKSTSRCRGNLNT